MPSPQEPQQQAPMEMTPVDGVVTQQPTAEPQPEFGNMRGGEEVGLLAAKSVAVFAPVTRHAARQHNHSIADMLATASTRLSKSHWKSPPAMQWNEHHNGLTCCTENPYSYSYPAYNSRKDIPMHGWASSSNLDF
ncbi:hypothetical protein F4811DRAFT_552573 [Daldinia bambusicola]|nr:hypothetical protein F4811DRAFT_552573 [Daldinia bambusicola]